MERLEFLIAFLATAVFLVTPVIAQMDFGDWWSTEYFWNEVLALPQEWSPTENMNKFLFNFMIPFIGLYAILLGIVRAIGIFATDTKLELVVAFIFAFMTLPSRIFITIVSLAFTLGGVWGFLIFLFMFIGGSYYYSLGFVSGHKARASLEKTYEKQMKHLRVEESILTAELQKLYTQLAAVKAGDPRAGVQITQINSKIEKLKDRVDTVRDKINNLKMAHRTL